MVPLPRQPRKSTTQPSADVMLFTSSTVYGAIQNYNVYDYDRTIPKFTPDGRLLQVEYASAAADHSSPLMVCRFNESSTLVWITLKRRNSVQNRMVLLHDDTILLAMSGVLADNLALLQTLQDETLKLYRTYNTYKPSPDMVAQIIANACQTHSFGGGIRPYGSSLMICGLQPTKNDNNNNVNDKGSIQICQTDPSGAITYHNIMNNNHGVDDGSAKKEIVPVIVGGTQASHRTLRQSMDQSIGNPTCVKDVLVAATSVLLKQQLQQDNRNIKEGQNSDDFTIEAVVVDPNHGMYRLTPLQIQIVWKAVIDTLS